MLTRSPPLAAHSMTCPRLLIPTWAATTLSPIKIMLAGSDRSCSQRRLECLNQSDVRCLFADIRSLLRFGLPVFCWLCPAYRRMKRFAGGCATRLLRVAYSCEGSQVAKLGQISRAANSTNCSAHRHHDDVPQLRRPARHHFRREQMRPHGARRPPARRAARRARGGARPARAARSRGARREGAGV